ncbi:low affinity iron permease family protein [Sphingomonas glacialis]|uniref:low affinity iron permease family protein n=1 Tax=Sphingomonas glacialis TaxID=658225 RepID=UPI001386C76A|nr:low affinity iron permease family protein [Sphingomonas glacialis]
MQGVRIGGQSRRPPICDLHGSRCCAAWFIVGGTAAENTLTLVLSVLAITLTQMVLNQQRLNERALHMKIDELVFAMKGARDEIAGIEGKTEEELEALRRSGDIADDVLKARHKD